MREVLPKFVEIMPKLIPISRLHLHKLKPKLFLSLVVIFIIYYFGLLTHLFERDYSHFTYPLDVDIDVILVDLKSHVKPTVEPLNTFDYHFKIRNKYKCRKVSDNTYDKVVILYVIKSALSNYERRDAIRRTWGWEERFSDVIIRRVFVLGVGSDPRLQDNIDEEYARHNDLVQADFFDSYYNNTIKTMIGFKWVLEYCRNSQFVMFVDDDMYMSTKNLLKFVRNPFNENLEYRKLLWFGKSWSSMPLSAFDGRLLAGYVFFSSPMRHKTSKWYISLDEYPFSKYPPYVTAGAYVMSYPALEDLYYTSLYTKRFKFDDIYIGILAKKCGISPLHNDEFYFWKKSYEPLLYKTVIASHGYGDPKELIKVWEEQRSIGHA